jgi:hypothetical protein
MTELQAIMDDHQGSATDSSAKSKRKANIEEQPGQQLARHEGLIDVSELAPLFVRDRARESESVFLRRKADQVTVLQVSSSSPLAFNAPQSCSLTDDHDLDVEPPPKRRLNRDQGMRDDNRAARDAGETSRTTEILAEIVAKKI